ncbi:MAG: efflux RND transporter periplasmic adaptor subunit [Alphaproteobacteria bacterium]|nr:efflux RND transporter periplasmic adaptor subunit [Alphaproteobacteria bacterium]
MNKKLLSGAVAAAIVIAGAVVFAARGAGGTRAGDYEFETASVDRGDVARIVSASGAVQPLDKVDVGSEVSGKITELYVDFNSPVKRNQVLAQIDPQTFRTAVESARGRLLQSQAAVATARSAIERSKVSVEIAEKTYNRQKALFAEQAISQAAWEQAESDFKYAQLDVRNNEVALQSAQAGLEQSKAALQEAELKLERTKILSPIDGVIINREVNIGQTVQSSMSVAKFFTIAADLSKIQIETAVVESDIGGIDVGDAVSFTVDAFAGERFGGVVEQVRPLGVEQANVVTYTVVVSAQNATGKLMPGMTANVEITADRAAGVLRVASDVTRFGPPKGMEVGGEEDGAPAGSQAGGQAGGPTGGGRGGGNGAGGPGGGGGGRGGNPTGEWLKQMGIEEARVAKINTEMQGEMERMRASMPQRPQQGGASALGGGGFGPPPGMMQQAQMQEFRQKMQASTDAVMRRNLSEAEFTQYNKLRIEQQAQKRATVYVLNAEGELERKTLVLGISDGSYAEVIRGAEEGDAFVVRATTDDKPDAKS